LKQEITLQRRFLQEDGLGIRAMIIYGAVVQEIRRGADRTSAHAETG
jgi:hypothetical protein